MDPTQTAWIVFLAGVVPAIVIALAGALVLARPALAIKKRMDAYKTLPVVTRIAAANATIATHVPVVSRAPDTIARAQRAIAALIDARDRLAASAATVRAMRRPR